MSEIVPAVMPKSFYELENAIYIASGKVPFLQIDIMDGVFVKGVTWPFNDMDTFIEMARTETMLPNWEDVSFEFDMMVSNPTDIVDKLVLIGASRIIYHFQSLKNPILDVKNFSDSYRISDNPAGVELVIAVPFDSKPEIILEIADMIDGVQIMGISPVGVQGSEFKNETIDTVKIFKEKYPNLKISVDGGVKEKNILDLVNAGTDRLVMGSAIFGNENPREELKRLLGIVNSI